MQVFHPGNEKIVSFHVNITSIMKILECKLNSIKTDFKNT